MDLQGWRRAPRNGFVYGECFLVHDLRLFRQNNPALLQQTLKNSDFCFELRLALRCKPGGRMNGSARTEPFCNLSPCLSEVMLANQCHNRGVPERHGATPSPRPP